MQRLMPAEVGAIANGVGDMMGRLMAGFLDGWGGAFVQRFRLPWIEGERSQWTAFSKGNETIACFVAD